jgi:hypothetical protein
MDRRILGSSTVPRVHADYWTRAVNSGLKGQELDVFDLWFISRISPMGTYSLNLFESGFRFEDISKTKDSAVSKTELAPN